MTDVKQPEGGTALRIACDVALALWIIAWVVGSTWLACMIGCGCKKVSDPVIADSTSVQGNSRPASTSRVRGLEPPRLILESHAP
jgi:hypothetical protein